MAPTSVATREALPARPALPAHTSPAHPATGPRTNRGDANAPAPPRPVRPTLSRNSPIDEILGLGSGAADSAGPDGRGNNNGNLYTQLAFDFDAPAAPEAGAEGRGDPARLRSPEDANAEPENLRAIFDANPELRRDWQDANAYREAFATPEDARAATALLADLNHMDALFFSRRPEDHAELARSIASLDPAAFASLAQAIAAQAAQSARGTRFPVGAQHRSAPLVTSAMPGADDWYGAPHSASSPGAAPPRVDNVQSRAGEAAAPNGTASPSSDAGSSVADYAPTKSISAPPAGPTPAQTEFFHATNAAAVETVLDAIESQVERLLPEGVSKNARHRVVGEIYRELDGTLRSNRQLAEQMRDAFRSGALDGEHQRAIVSLIAGRARQALPGVAKRVLSEWTSTVVAANHDRRARQRAAERRVDIAGSSGGGNKGHRPTSPRDIDYARMSDADILNL